MSHAGLTFAVRACWLLLAGNPMGNLYRYRLRFFALSHGRAGGQGPELRLWKDETRYRQVLVLVPLVPGVKAQPHDGGRAQPFDSGVG